MDDVKYKIRRRMAVISFMAVLAVLAAIVASWFVGGKDTAGIISASMGPLAIIIPALTAIVLAYYGVTHHAEIKK